jgi:hypothetical protein
MNNEQQKQVTEGGHATFSVKVTQAVYDLVNILCEGLEHGTNGNDLVKMFIHAFIESAKHDGPVSPEMQQFLNMLTLDPGWHKAFNFADVTARMEVAQVILILQQPGKHGFGLTMIDKPWMGEPTMTLCIDDILERVIKLGMPGLDKRMEWIEQQFHCTSRRETLILLCEYMADYLKKEQDLSECPQLGNNHDWGRSMDDIQKFKRKPHRTPDSLANSQQKIIFDDDDREIADYEAKAWEGEHKSNSDDLTEGMTRPFDQEW